MFLNALTFSCCEISLCIYSVKERNAGLSEIKVTFMSNIILLLDSSAWNHSDTQIHQTPNLYSSRSFLQFLFWHLFHTVVCSFERSLECRLKQLLKGRCVFEPNPNSCCVLTLPLLGISKWIFLWPVRYFCGNVRHSSLSSQASDSINPFSFLLPCTDMSSRALDCCDLFPSVPQSLKLTLFLKFFSMHLILNPKLIFGFRGRSKGSRPLNPDPLQRPEHKMTDCRSNVWSCVCVCDREGDVCI